MAILTQEQFTEALMGLQKKRKACALGQADENATDYILKSQRRSNGIRKKYQAVHSLEQGRFLPEWKQWP